ncbi:MAG TPA: YtxH domain-containing protein [Vicinamibacterales bacterium]|nr:YtxH domain-containing protein [Vicinamibacterales bacterium]
MNEQTAVWLGAMAGAVVGGALGFLYLTDRGRRLRDDLEPRLTDLATELGRTWDAAERARAAVQAPWSGSATGPRVDRVSEP